MIRKTFSAILLLCVAVVSAHADSFSTQEYQIKAAFLYNFAKFIEWPFEAQRTSSNVFVIGIYGPDPFGADIDELLKDETINNLPVAVKRFKDIQSVDCHILFITVEDPKQLHEAIEGLQGKSILTVGQGENFIKSGGMIAFYIEDEKVRFEINKNVTDKSGLQISSQLLKLAKIAKDS